MLILLSKITELVFLKTADRMSGKHGLENNHTHATKHQCSFTFTGNLGLPLDLDRKSHMKDLNKTEEKSSVIVQLEMQWF